MPAVAVYLLRGNARSQKIGQALALGIRAAGEIAHVRSDADYREPDTRVCAFYGFEKAHPRIFRDYIADGRTVVFVDLGYWGRREGGRYTGFHKVAVNDRHPTVEPRRRYDDSRVRRFGVSPAPWRKGRHILVAGMSGKAAETIGLRPEEWERNAIAEIRRHTDRPIIYRPKPSWEEARPIEGTRYSPARESLSDVLADCHAVVTHHSNVAVDALVAGVPVFCEDGVAKTMGLRDLSLIETPHYPDGRGEWLAAVAWWQWSLAELTNGAMWRFLQSEGRV